MGTAVDPLIFNHLLQFTVDANWSGDFSSKNKLERGAGEMDV